ncbi:hypothetical protein [Lewinella sp. W8]|uniref:hypothetical protein n=1 Tax=Lewinella sp. W8 TaxID=2528208 RepID=UPI00106730E3|nr:hypothetical protein [Lewinella sp. W8]MTB53861.1 hypothetical protein [Lewinella sp. W8]
MEPTKLRHTSFLLRAAAVAAALGLGLVGLFHDLPLRVLLWDAAWWTPVAEALGYEWTEWVTSPVIDQNINLVGKIIGVICCLAGGTMALTNRPKILRVAVVAATVFLVLQQLLLWKDHFWQIGHLMEYSLRAGAPLLWWYFFRGRSNGAVRTAIRWAVALTFLGHGLYAAGVHPVPGHFILMTQSGLGVGEQVARNLLLLVGVLDFLAALLLILPNEKAQRLSLYWIIPWAILTTLARIWSYSTLVPLDTLLSQWIPATIIRLPHILVPMALWYWRTSANPVK